MPDCNSFLDPSRSLVAVHHDDVPSPPSTSLSPSLLSSLTAPAFTSAVLHLTLHSPSVLAHLHFAYNIEEVGQNGSTEIDNRVYDFLPKLRSRQWSSPLTALSGNDDSALRSSKDSQSTSNFDSPDPTKVQADLLGSAAGNDRSLKNNVDPKGRCIVEYSMRGVSHSKATRGNHIGGKPPSRSEAGKILRGLEGLRSVGQGRVQSLTSHECLRIPTRQVEAHRRVEKEVRLMYMPIVSEKN